MLRHTLSPLTLALLLASASACAGSHKHAEVPDFTEKGWSPPSNEVTQAKADPPIQPATPQSDDAAKVATPDKPAAVASTKSDAPPGADSDVVSGAALPPAPIAPKPAKAKKASKSRKGAKHT